jgi:hypothetical protein
MGLRNKHMIIGGIVLTENESRALYVMTKEALSGCGGHRPEDFYHDEYTWVSAQELRDAGWSRHEAAGTYGSLMEKGLIYPEDKQTGVLATKTWKAMIPMWDSLVAEFG